MKHVKDNDKVYVILKTNKEIESFIKKLYPIDLKIISP